MMWLSDIFTARKQKLFLALLRRHGDLLVQTAHGLTAFVQDPSSGAADELAEFDARSEKIVTDTIDALTDTFVTPFDRQDIYNLVEAMDDMIAYLASSAREIDLFKIKPTPQIGEMVDLLLQAATYVHTAIENIDAHGSFAVECANKACNIENTVEDLYRRTLAELFDTDDMHRIFKLREIYRHLSNAADRADAIGKLIGKIVVKVA